MIHLYSYYYFINTIINNSDNINHIELSPNDYFIVNSNWIKQIKEIYSFDFISNILKSNKDIEKIINKNQDKREFKLMKLKDIYEILKKISSDNYEKINIKNDKEFLDSNNYIVDVCQIKKNEQENFYIYKNFQIIHKNIIELFKITINNKEKKFSNIFINDKNIIINLPEKLYGFNQFITMIGKIDNYIFITDYILIYCNKNKRDNNYNEIKYNLNEFLSKYQSEELFEPFLDDKSEVLGEIIKYNKKNGNFNIINEKDEKDEKDIIYNSFDNTDNANFNDEYNLNPPKNRKPLLDNNFNYNNIPLIGLENIGATCYMNATLQCFCHIKEFVNKFKYSKYIIDKVKANKNNLTAAFKLLIEKLWPDNYNPQNFPTYYAPRNFKSTISIMNPLFEGIAANDSKDLVNFIIMTLHEELNQANKNIQNNNNLFIDQRNKQLMFNLFIENFNATNNSIISSIFYATNCNKTQCGTCQTKTYNYQTYFFIVFPLEEVVNLNLE